MKRTLSPIKLAIYGVLILLLVSASVVSLRILTYRTWNPWTTDDIKLYPEMRKELIEAYPNSPDILLPFIPQKAKANHFIASPDGSFRNPKFLELEIVLPPLEATEELGRLLKLEVNREDFNRSTKENGRIHFEYILGDQFTYTEYAQVEFDPLTYTFRYRLGAGY